MGARRRSGFARSGRVHLSFSILRRPRVYLRLARSSSRRIVSQRFRALCFRVALYAFAIHRCFAHQPPQTSKRPSNYKCPPLSMQFVFAIVRPRPGIAQYRNFPLQNLSSVGETASPQNTSPLASWRTTQVSELSQALPLFLNQIHDKSRVSALSLSSL